MSLSGAGKPLDLLVVDDSRIFRSLIEKALAGAPEVRIVGSVYDGKKALEHIREKGPPDLVTLDLEMPVMDGMATLAAIRELNAARAPGTKEIAVIMLSAHTREGSEATMRALEGGAMDFIAKPQGSSPEQGLAILREQILAKALAFRSMGRGGAKAFAARAVAGAGARSAPTPAPGVPGRRQAVLIGCSTGGPKALMVLMPALCQAVTLPILITQHMPAGFTKSLAESLSRKCRHRVVEAAGGEVVEPGVAYIAPGGWHMVVQKDAQGRVVTALNQQPPENGCRPSVDVMFRSCATVWGGDVLAMILTGMGSDGTLGLRPLKRAGARVLVQDEATSVVWGMPGSAVAAGFVDEVLPLEKIADIAGRSCR